MRRIITLTTDFGEGSPYVAEMKGAILSVCNDVVIVDATHSISAQNVVAGARAIRQYVPCYPAGTVHVAVVDPGVGSDRRILLVRNKDQWFVAPDNGLLTHVLDDDSDVRIVDNAEFWRANVSATFHGRDIMGPVAAHLAAGNSAEELARAICRNPIRLDSARAKVTSDEIVGAIVEIDSFGNLVTNISAADCQQISSSNGSLHVEFRGRRFPIVKTYSSYPSGGVVALFGSQGWLEIAICNGNAADLLHASGTEADTVTVRRST